MSRRVCLTFLLLTIFPVTSAGANNNFFLPGDAFFYAEVDHEWFLKNILDDAPIIEYTRPQGSGKFCGYAGHYQLTLRNMTPEMRVSLQEAYAHLRRQYPLVVDSSYESKFEMKDGQLVELSRNEVERFERNPVRILIYNQDFDLARFRPCFRYNENWADAAARFGHSRDDVASDFFVNDAASIEEDWRDAALVTPLRFSSDNPGLEGQQLLRQVIDVNCQEIQVLLFPDAAPRDIAYPQPTFAAEIKGADLGGGVFNVQDQTDSTTPQVGDPAETDDDPEFDEVPFVGYRVIGSQLEILHPQAEHWVPGPIVVSPEIRDLD